MSDSTHELENDPDIVALDDEELDDVEGGSYSVTLPGGLGDVNL